MYTSGQLGLNPETGDLVPGGIGPQAEQVISFGGKYTFLTSSDEINIHFGSCNRSIFIYPLNILVQRFSLHNFSLKARCHYSAKFQLLIIVCRVSLSFCFSFQALFRNLYTVRD